MKNIRTSVIVSFFAFMIAFEISLLVFFRELYPYGYEAVKHKVMSDFGLMYVHFISLFIGCLFAFFQFVFFARHSKKKYSFILLILFSLVALVCFFYAVCLKQYPMFIYVTFFYCLSYLFARNESQGV